MKTSKTDIPNLHLFSLREKPFRHQLSIFSCARKLANLCYLPREAHLCRDRMPGAGVFQAKRERIVSSKLQGYGGDRKLYRNSTHLQVQFDNQVFFFHASNLIIASDGLCFSLCIICTTHNFQIFITSLQAEISLSFGCVCL